MLAIPKPSGPSWRWVLVHVVVAMGIFAMHQAITSDIDTGHGEHHSTAMTSAHEGSTAPTALTAEGGGHGSTLMDGCNALVACMAMLIGFGAVSMLSGPRRIGIIRQVRSTLRLALPPPPGGLGISIRLRTTILRC